jgi:RHS repeat-associated protein
MWKTYYYAGSQLIALRVLTQTGNTLYYLHSDHLGSTSLTTDSSGNVTARQNYYPYGAIRSGGGMPTDVGYTGQRLDATGLMHYGARYYSSYLNRWIQPDTIVPDLNNPQSLNRYSYVRNNPVKYTDPTGHKEDDGCSTEGCNLLKTDQEKIIRDAEYVRKYNFYRGCERHGGPGCPNVGEILVFTAVGFTVMGLLSAAPEAIGLALDKISPAAIGAASSAATSATAAACRDGDCTNELLQLRQAYENAVRNLTAEVSRRFAAGQPVEEIARWAHAARRALGVTYKGMTPAELLEQIYARNIVKYGDPLGPTIEWLLGKGTTWEEIIERAVTPGGKDIISKLLGK